MLDVIVSRRRGVVVGVDARGGAVKKECVDEGILIFLIFFWLKMRLFFILVITIFATWKIYFYIIQVCFKLL